MYGVGMASEGIPRRGKSKVGRVDSVKDRKR